MKLTFQISEAGCYHNQKHKDEAIIHYIIMTWLVVVEFNAPLDTI